MLVLLACAIVAAITILAQAPTKAYADDIIVSVGYNGGPFYQKGIYTDAQLREMSGGYVYDYINFENGGYLRKGFGVGVSLASGLSASCASSLRSEM
jgi:hypothetical protein